jgi:integrase
VKRHADGKAKRFLSVAELAALGKAMRDLEAIENRRGLSAIRALLLTGCRRMEILALPWAWLDAKGRCIRFEDTKSGAQLRPIAAEAVKHLEAQLREGGCTWVFPADRGDGHFIGLPRVLERVCGKAELEGVTVHSLRHTFASVAAEMGYSELTIAGLLGHTIPGVTARYAHVPDRALLSAADAVAARITSALDGTAAAVVIPLQGRG